MERIKLTDRIIIEMMSNQDNTPMEDHDIQQILCNIGVKICNGHASGIEDTCLHKVQWEHETERFGGLRKGIVRMEIMEEIIQLLNDYDEAVEQAGELSLDNTIAFRDDAIYLLTRIIEENKL